MQFRFALSAVDFDMGTPCSPTGFWRMSGHPAVQTALAQPVFRWPRSSPPLCFCSSLTRSNRRGADPYARWWGRGAAARRPPIPINQHASRPEPAPVHPRHRSCPEPAPRGEGRARQSASLRSRSRNPATVRVDRKTWGSILLDLRRLVLADLALMLDGYPILG
jgi:hypothetical protein